MTSNCSNMVKGMDFKFDVHVPRNSPDMAHYKVSEKGHGQRHTTHDPLKFTWQIYTLSECLLVFSATDTSSACCISVVCVSLKHSVPVLISQHWRGRHTAISLLTCAFLHSSGT